MSLSRFTSDQPVWAITCRQTSDPMKPAPPVTRSFFIKTHGSAIAVDLGWAPAQRQRIGAGTGGGGRTHKSVRTVDFESTASANSATPARGGLISAMMGAWPAGVRGSGLTGLPAATPRTRRGRRTRTSAAQRAWRRSGYGGAWPWMRPGTDSEQADHPPAQPGFRTTIANIRFTDCRNFDGIFRNPSEAGRRRRSRRRGQPGKEA